MMRDSHPVQLRLILPSVTRLDLDEDQRDVLIRTLREIVAADRFPLSPRVRCSRQILQQLEPPAASVEPFPPPKAPAEPSRALKPKEGAGDEQPASISSVDAAAGHCRKPAHQGRPGEWQKT
jgi:hypothetical protein